MSSSVSVIQRTKVTIQTDEARHHITWALATTTVEIGTIITVEIMWVHMFLAGLILVHDVLHEFRTSNQGIE